MPEKMNLGGKEVLVQELDFEIGREEWNEYRLLDGGKVRVKNTVVRIFRVVDEEGHQVFNADNDPEIAVRATTQVVPIGLPW